MPHPRGPMTTTCEGVPGSDPGGGGRRSASGMTPAARSAANTSAGEHRDVTIIPGIVDGAPSSSCPRRTPSMRASSYRDGGAFDPPANGGSSSTTGVFMARL